MHESSEMLLRVALEHNLQYIAIALAAAVFGFLSRGWLALIVIMLATILAYFTGPDFAVKFSDEIRTALNAFYVGLVVGLACFVIGFLARQLRA